MKTSKKKREEKFDSVFDIFIDTTDETNEREIVFRI